jgi:hypothetical protein
MEETTLYTEVLLPILLTPMNEKDKSLPVIASSSDMPKELDPLFGYLQTQQGHEIASRVLGMLESIKHSTLDKSTGNVRVEKYIQAMVILAVVIATSVLVAFGKFESSVGVLFGTLVGYVFGKK